jgi:hypothetical protein
MKDQKQPFTTAIRVMKIDLFALLIGASALNLQPSTSVCASPLGTVVAGMQRYDGPANGSDCATAIAVDASGNVFVTGYSTASGGVTVDWATIAYSGAGTPLWTNRYDGPGHSSDFARAVAADAGGNVIVTGWSDGGESGYDYATIRYSCAGVPLWTNRYCGPAAGHDYVRAVALDASGDVVVTGSSDAGGSLDYATVKYSKAGLPLWTNRYSWVEDRNDIATALAVDGVGSVIVTGSSYNGTDNAFLTIKYSCAGEPLWTNRCNGPAKGWDAARGVAVDAAGNVLVTGAFTAVDGWREYATIKLSSAGVLLWINHYHGPGKGDDIPCAVAIDANDNIIVTGYSAVTNFSPCAFAYTTIKYSSAGVPVWTNRYHGPRNGGHRANTVRWTGAATCISTVAPPARFVRF